MAPLADFILANVPLPKVPTYLTTYIQGQTPLSTWPAVLTALVSYLTIVFGTRWFMKDRPALVLNGPFRVHNIFLSSGSLLLLVLMAEEVFPLIRNDGFFSSICAEKSWTPVRGHA